MKKTRLIGFAALILTLIVDQLSKAWILSIFDPAAPVASRHIPVLPFFDLVLWWNRGVSFGLLVHEHDFMPYALTALALVISAGLSVWLWRTGKLLEALSIGLVIGGAIGNAIDRIRFGAVVDFLYFYRGDWYWPAFNIADSAICVGVVLMIVFGSNLKKSTDTVGSDPKTA